jgi:hypothetical protein
MLPMGHGSARGRTPVTRLRCGIAAHARGNYHAPTLIRGGPMRATPSDDCVTHVPGTYHYHAQKRI